MAEKLHIRKNDNVVVLSGKEKGKRGKVLKVNPRTRRAILENVNFIKKHTKANQAKRQKGGIVEKYRIENSGKEKAFSREKAFSSKAKNCCEEKNSIQTKIQGQ